MIYLILLTVCDCRCFLNGTASMVCVCVCVRSMGLAKKNGQGIYNQTNQASGYVYMMFVKVKLYAHRL